MADVKSTSSYLDPPKLIGRPNSDGTISLTPLELKGLSDFNYYVAKMLQGGLNLANLNAATNQTFTDTNGNVAEIALTAMGLETSVSNINGDISTLEQTASGLTTSVSNLEGDVSSVSQTVSGLGVTTSGGTTYITGDHVKTGTLEGVNLKSVGQVSELLVNEGAIEISDTTPEPYKTKYATIGYYNTDAKVHIETLSVPLKLESGTNLSLDASSSGAIYLGTGNSGEDVNIGNSGGTVNLVGTVLVNGVPI